MELNSIGHQGKLNTGIEGVIFFLEDYDLILRECNRRLFIGLLSGFNYSIGYRHKTTLQLVIWMGKE